MQTYHAPVLDHAHARTLWRGMQAQITEQSIAAAPQGYAWFKVVVLSAALLGCLIAAWTCTSVFVLLALCVAIAFLLAQCAFLGHDAGHGSLQSRAWLRDLLGQWCMTVITGLCFEEWYARHSAHHRFCQDESRDPDMDVGVVVSLTAQARSRKRGLGLFMARYQHLHVWVLSLFFAYSQRHLSQWGALMSPLRYWRDLLGLALHLALWIALPVWVLDVDVTRVVVVYMLPMLVLGPYLAAIFWLNHIGMPLIGNTEAISFLEHQAISSRTVLSPKAMDWFFGGLNYQIEHHLFPNVPSFRLSRVQPIVQATLTQHSIAYQSAGFREAVRAVAAHFRHVAQADQGQPTP